jgi:hypothetical protein
MTLRAVARSLPKVTRPALARRGKAFAALATDWTAIVGAELAAATLPERLTAPAERDADAGGVLTIRVAGGAAMELQHLGPQLIDRINAYLGFRAVTRLKLRQAPLPGRRQLPRETSPPSQADLAVVSAAVAEIGDPDLRAALTRLGLALKGAGRERT